MRVDDRGAAYSPRHASRGQFGSARSLVSRLALPGITRSVAHTAVLNVAVTGIAAFTAIIIARATSVTVRGEYSAVTAWIAIVGMFGELGLPVALAYFVAREPRRACQYLAAARTMMIAVGAVAVLGGIVVAPALGRGDPTLTRAYRIGFASLLIACLGDSYMAALMGRDLRRWNSARLIQPTVTAVGVAALWLLQLLTLEAAILALLASRVAQLGWSYLSCRRAGLAPARFAADLIRPLAKYGVGQIAATVPWSINVYLDQLVLSVTGSPANLGRYSIAVSMTLLPAPLVAAIGYVLLPKIASQDVLDADIRLLHRNSVLLSAGLSTVILLPLALLSTWLIPAVFGAGYEGAVVLVWILAPGGIFLACGDVVTNVLRGHGRQTAVARAEAAAVIATVVLLFSLLPVIGVAGAAVASTVPYGISLALMLRALRRVPVPAAAIRERKPVNVNLAPADPSGSPRA